MRVLPVIDLKHGQVVRGVAGRRAEYRPIEGLLATDCRPESVARAFVERLGLREAYVADLDAIAGADPAWEVYAALARAGLELWVDAGIADAKRAAALAGFAAGGPLERIVAGLESVAGPGDLAEIARAVDGGRLVFSLDLMAGRPIVRAPAEAGANAGGTGRPFGQDDSPETIVAAAVAAGIRSVIVLDLARVGVGQGVGTEPLCRQLAGRWPELEIIAGGGVRSMADLRGLSAAGCAAALVASALHDGRIGPAELAELL
jgi:phosphoribosylformimino-5-aminoimidazole carboxamide ribotide isomerase